MASKRRIRRRSCQRKKRFPTSAAALDAMHQVIRSGKKNGGYLHIYSCRFCGGYHFGHAAGSNSEKR